MKTIRLLSSVFALLWFAGMSSCGAPEETIEGPPAVYRVDPFLGTAEHGHVYPGATVPFGAVQLSPDNGTQGWDWCSGYNYIDSTIVGFTHTHLSGTGIGDLCDVLVMPLSEPLDLTTWAKTPLDKAYLTTFSHKDEMAEPGYYAVVMDNGIQAELTATTHTGVHRYTFPGEVSPRMVIDLGYAINWDRPVDTRLTRVNDTLLTGHRHSAGWARDQRLYFAMAFSAPVSALQLADSSAQAAGQDLQGRQVIGQVELDAPAGATIELRVGISSANVEGALAALEQERNTSFSEARQAARQAWADELSAIRVSGKPEDEAVFYTSLYRTALAPVIYSDALGQYKGVDGEVQRAEGYTRYDIFSLWDTFRAANPLYTLTQPDRIDDFIRSMLAHYDEYGLLPVWSLLGNETNTMTGYHAVPVIADAYRKGFRDYDTAKALQAMQTSAEQDIRGTDHYRDYGYIPYDKEGQSVTKTLEYAYDDWCIAQMAGSMGETAVSEAFQDRAAYYRNMFDPSTGFMRAKMADGSWKVPFDPAYSDHNFEVAEYTEGNAWQHSWFVPHDVEGLIQLHGGREPFIQKLDSLFTVDSEITGENASSDISGLIGQYAHGNEPSHHIAYLYNYAGAPWKTQARVRDILTSQYNTSPAGLCGNEDCGQMSAWYVFSAMGFYPVNPAQGVYVLGSPLFDEVELRIPDGQTFRVEAPGASGGQPYIQSASLNGEPLERSWITHEEITAGGTLRLQMGPEPNTALWTGPAAFPPSMTPVK